MKIKIILITALVIANCFCFFYSWQKINYAYEIEIGEGFLLNASQLLAKGEVIYYKNPDINFHKITALYPPVYYLLSAAWVKLLGINFTGGRLISWISNYLSAILIFLTVARLTKNRPLSLMMALMLPLLLPIAYWGQYMRVDSLGLFLSLFALYLIALGNKYLFYLSPLVLVLAFFTKYNSASLIVPIFLMIIITKKTKWLLYFVEFSLMSGVIFFLANKFTDGAYFLNTVTYIGSSTYSFLWALRFVIYIILSYSFITLSFLKLIFEKIKPFKTDIELLAFLYLVIQLPYALLVMGKTGSDMNHFFELSALSLLALGLVINKHQGQGESKTKICGTILLITPLFVAWILSYYLTTDIFLKLQVFLISSALLLAAVSSLKLSMRTLQSSMTIFIVLQVLVLYFRPLGLAGDKHFPEEKIKRLKVQEEYYRKATDVLKENPGPALTWITGSLVLSGKESVYDAFTLNNLNRNGVYNPEKFYKNIAQKEYSVMIMSPRFGTLYEQGKEARADEDNSSFFTREDFIEVVKANYKITGKVGSQYVFYPKKD